MGYFGGRKRGICGTEKQRFQEGEKGFVRRGEKSRAGGFLALGQGAGRSETQGRDGGNAGRWRRKCKKKFTEMASMSFQLRTFAA